MKTFDANQSGFTLLEILTGVTILAIVLGIAVPSFSETFQRNRLASQVNELVTALNFARSEAYKRGIRVTVCPANSGQTNCSAGTDWSTGWIAFHDGAGTAGTKDGTDEILQVWPATGGGFTVAPSPTTLTNIGFLPLGTVPASGSSFTIYKSGCTGQNKRQVSVGPTGRVSLTKQAC